MTVQELLASMDICEIDTSVIAGIGWASHELCVENNEYILECSARYPHRLVGLVSIQPQAGNEALLELERCVHSGVKGIGEMRADTQGFDLTSGAFTDIVDYLVTHNLVLLSHSSEPVGHDYPGKGALTPEIIYPFIMRHPDLKIVLAHWGGGLPFYAAMPEVKAIFTNVYFDTAASPYLYSPSVYRQVLDIVGSEHVIFGSDYPLISPMRALAEIRSSDLAESVQSAVIGGNAQRLFGLGTGHD